MRQAAAPSDASLQQRWDAAVAALGLPLHRMPSGAGHDAMKLHEVMPQAMLFMRGLNAGISHNPLRVDHQPRHRTVRARLHAPAGTPVNQELDAWIDAGPRTVLESNAKRADEHLVLEDPRRATKVVARTLAEVLEP